MTEGFTFLFTDIEGSTSLWERYPEAMRSALAIHDALLRRAIDENSGRTFKTVGDAFYAVFRAPDDGLAAALQAQRALHHEKWKDIPGIRVRMALNTGAADQRDGDYFGPALNRVARLLSAGHGGQTLLSQSAKSALGALPEQIELRDLGERRLKDLARPERIFQILAADLPADFPPLNTLEAVPNNLPTALTNFVGREREIGDVKRLLAATRLLTLTGAGGCGKTRLSLQVGADLLDTFPGGVWFVELAALSDSSRVPRALAVAMSVREQRSKPTLTSIADTVRNKRVLMILDNCEHLIASCAEAAETLLHACPNLRIMASSREVLGIAGETVWRVPSLMQREAIRLFCDRVTAIAPAFTFNEQNGSSVIQICQRLDGIPLAIELAAARVKVLHIDQIASRLNDRFRLLTGGSRTALARHRTLRAAIEWSYDLLSDAERELLRRISVFAGGFTLEAAESICSDIEDAHSPAQDSLDLLSHLVEKSLVMVERTEYEAIYSLLDTVRQYSRDRLLESGEIQRLSRRHLDYFLELAERAVPELHGSDQVRWLDRLDRNHENFRAALTWCQADLEGAELGLRLAAALSRFWYVRGYFEEGRSWLTEAMARAGAAKRNAEWANAFRAAGTLAMVQSDYVAARSYLEDSLAIFREIGDGSAVAATLLNLANVAQIQGNLALAQSFSEEALSKFRELGAPRGIATALSTLALMLHQHGEDDRARPLLEESLRIFGELSLSDGIAHSLDLLGVLASSNGDYAGALPLHGESLAIRRKLGDKIKIAVVLLNLGHAAVGQGDVATAESVLQEALQIAHQLGERRWMSLALHNLGLAALKRSDQKAARQYMLDALQIRSDLGDKVSIAYSLEGIAAVAAKEGNPQLSARLLGSAEALRSTIGTPLERPEEKQQQELVKALRERWSAELFEEERASGRCLPLDEAVDQALKDSPRAPRTTTQVGGRS
jgi:predicted ATPase/class 3 adenylate cyclase